MTSRRELRLVSDAAKDRPERSAFQAFRTAFRANEAEPNLRHAKALVRAWVDYATVVGVDRP